MHGGWAMCLGFAFALILMKLGVLLPSCEQAALANGYVLNKAGEINHE